jgi:hypothetical protein
MSWARHYPFYDDLGEDKRKRGYSYKLCPYSSEYRDKYKYEGRLYTGMSAGQATYIEGIFVAGNSTDRSFFGLDYSSYPCSLHTTTSGRLIQAANPPGWQCEDPNCYYFTTVVSGMKYRET